MAYAGLPPATFTNNLTNVQLIDDISGSFNGSTQTFALTSSSAPFHAVSARSLLVTLGGITQKPQVDYTVDGSNITFTTAPASGLTFAARNIYGLNYLNNVNDGVITPAKLSTGAPTWNTGGTVTVSGDLNVTGSFNSGTQGLFWGDNEPANFGNDNDLKIYHDGINSYITDQGTGNLFVTGSGIRIQSDDNRLLNSVGNIILKTDFFKIRDSKKYWNNNPGLSPKLYHQLTDRLKKLRVIGGDYISVSSYQNRELGRIAHREFLASDNPILLVEDMDLSKIDISPKQIFCFPLLINKSDGAPVTIIAQL